MYAVLLDSQIQDNPFDLTLLPHPLPSRQKQSKLHLASMEDVHAIFDVMTDDAVGRAKGIAKLIEQHGGQVIAVHGCRLGKFYNRRCLVEASRNAIKAIAHDIEHWSRHHLMHLEVLEPRLTWTFTCRAPFAIHIDQATSSLFEIVGANVEWELKERRDSSNIAKSTLHQAIIVTLPSTSCLAELEGLIREWRQKYQGKGELLPGACLALI